MYVKKESSEIAMLGLQRAIDEQLTIKKRGDKFRVKNIGTNQTYTVATDKDAIVSCTCPHYKYRKITCKHMFVVLIKSKYQYKLNLS